MTPGISGRVLSAVAMGLAVLLVVWRGASLSVKPPGPGGELRELMRALSQEPTRPVEGRLSGISYVAPTANSAGWAPSPEVQLAAARVEEVHGGDDAASSAALAIASLALGSWAQAVDALERAIQQDAANPSLQNDLAVAYLASASADGFADYWVRGLAAANRAIGLDKTRPEPYFNRALALI